MPAWDAQGMHEWKESFSYPMSNLINKKQARVSDALMARVFDACLRNSVTRAWLILFLLATLLISCKKKEDQPVISSIPTPYVFQIPFRFPSQLNIPADNPMTQDGIDLGRYLFYDGRLSGRSDPDSLMSCSTCHIQAHSFECGIDNPQFTGGHPHGLSGCLPRITCFP